MPSLHCEMVLECSRWPRNVGTSVQIIQECYGKQATAAVFATRLGD